MDESDSAHHSNQQTPIYTLKILSAESIILLVDILIFTTYVVSVLIKFGIPKNLSTTYYTFEEQKKGTGLLFPALLVFICCTTLPIWISTTYHASSWGTIFLFCPIVTLFCLLAVAGSAHYKRCSSLIYFHYTCAIIAAICAVVWLFFAAYQTIFVILRFSILGGLLGAGIRTDTLKTCPLFWLETTAFYCIFLTLLVIYIVPIPL